MTQRKILLATIAVLLPIWWLTRPSDAPVGATSNVWGEGPPLISRTVTSNDGEPAWASNIDARRPECRKMKQEMLQQAADGTLTDLVYIGDCDKRLAQQTSGD